MISPVLPTYARADLAFERGEGAYLFSTDGRRFLDFSSGVAVTSLGHAHPHLVAALKAQAEKLWHCSNLYRVPGQERAAERLVGASFADTAFFCNSGAEAMECAIKVARKYHAATGHPERQRLICCTGSFHGRTLATLAAAGNQKYLDGFGPPAAGFDHVAYGNLNEMRAAVTQETAGIVVEPVQGEGGLATASAEYLEGLRAIADEFGILLVFDEVQSGMGRTGKLFAYQWTKIAPDVMGLAKGLGGGFPVGACLASERAAQGMTAGTHGSTFGGNPLAMAATNAVLDVMLAPNSSRGSSAWPGCCGSASRRSPRSIRPLRRGARQGHAGRLALQCRQRRGGRALAPRRASDRGGGRERGAAAAAAHHRGEPRRGGVRHHRARGAAMDAMTKARPRHFLDLDRIDRATLRRLLDKGHAFKRGTAKERLPGKILAMIFEKPSTRTRLSFEVAIKQLGGDAIVMASSESQLSRGETMADTARVLSRYVDGVMIRTGNAQNLEELAAHASVPVVNGLTELTHPCQIMADVMTLEERKGDLAGKIVAWCGDGNNVATSWIHAAARFGFELRLACPKTLEPPATALAWAKGEGASRQRRRRPARGGNRRRLHRDRYLGLDERGRSQGARRHAAALPGRCAAHGARQARRHLHALPAGQARPGSDGRRDRRAALGGLGRGREPPPVQKAILAWCMG